MDMDNFASFNPNQQYHAPKNTIQRIVKKFQTVAGVDKNKI
jgi:hypothetical protein